MFAHYSNANIREVSLLDALRSPLFMAYYEGQPFNDNLLRPCPILENEGVLADMVEATSAKSTDLHKQEGARALCDKCGRSIAEWTPTAERLWTDPSDPQHEKRQDPGQGMADTDKRKFERIGRERPFAEATTETGKPAA